MEGLSPALKCVLEMQAALKNSESVRIGLGRYVDSASRGDEFAPCVRHFLFAWDQGQEWKKIIASQSSPHRRSVLDLAATALQGQPILSHLEELREELMVVTDCEIQRHLEILPLKMMVPLLLLQFPAFLILLFGPVLSKLLHQLNH